MRPFRKSLIWLYLALLYVMACTVFASGMLVVWSVGKLVRVGLGL